LFHPGVHVLDVACGGGRHATAAALLGADVVAIDDDRKKVTAAQSAAQECGASITWGCEDLRSLDLPNTSFDVVMVFNYLDRKRMADFKDAVRPGGHLMLETFLESQAAFGWGPKSENHLLKAGELFTLVEPFELQFAREVLEVIDGRNMAVGSVLARRPLT
jgi:2-polyprenyl-3-methyl-5-hydroxy-6-metoxy-1,4-benzoquinol methylase